jgi:hypothetical protein
MQLCCRLEVVLLKSPDKSDEEFRHHVQRLLMAPSAPANMGGGRTTFTVCAYSVNIECLGYYFSRPAARPRPTRRCHPRWRRAEA